ncbi:monocarboxylate transporter 14 [Caerostris darwini]|uniref:Monocarboxylate transporter 14 n=1 Tax=Caerostris darwini TaxID=1538125 RepID=A0AAV4PXN2_9ARAC|nr:monocarboxylate transporter 14 [Caerostris darwini]
MDLHFYYYERKVQPRPDQGYAWVVALSCFFINFVLVGIARSVAVLYVALVETYGVTREEATLPFSIRVALRNLSGPLIGLLGLRYGIRAVTMVGGFVAAFVLLRAKYNLDHILLGSHPWIRIRIVYCPTHDDHKSIL